MNRGPVRIRLVRRNQRDDFRRVTRGQRPQRGLFVYQLIAKNRRRYHHSLGLYPDFRATRSADANVRSPVLKRAPETHGRILLNRDRIEIALQIGHDWPQAGIGPGNAIQQGNKKAGPRQQVKRLQQLPCQNLFVAP